MKLKVRDRSFQLKDDKRGIMRTMSPHEEFERLWPEEYELINSLIYDLRIYCIDYKYILPFAPYISMRDFHRIVDGENVAIKQGSTVKLPREEAQDLMIKKYVKPEDEGWYPGKNPQFNEFTNNAPKVMYDPGEQPKVSWIRKFREGLGR